MHPIYLTLHRALTAWPSLLEGDPILTLPLALALLSELQ